MMHPDLARQLAEQRVRDLQTGAARSRLAAIARCCRPSYLAQLAGQVRSWRLTSGSRTCCA